ncbi:MAG: type II toxin-antitoxin system RelE/ParE family toxin [Bryobacteraceae bacterium]
MKRIAWSEQAKFDIRAIEKPHAMRILAGLHKFAESGEGDVKLLQGDTEELRLRIGDYRLFFVYSSVEGIEVRRVRHRREAYR